MGDFSRDPRERVADSVTKHYVGVRMQQGVPILDADWNELEDLRKHELYELFTQFIGNGVPSGNDGFRIEGLAGGGIGTIVLQATPSVEGFSSIEINLSASTVADILGFLPGNTYTQREGSSPALLTGNAAEPFPLSDELTLSVRVNNGSAQLVTFVTDDFADISRATAEEVVAVLNSSLIELIARVGTGNDFIITGGDGSTENAGRILIEGLEVLNESNLTYTSQPLFQNSALANKWQVDPVSPVEAPTGSDRTDMVYLDVWEREVGSDEDDDIIEPRVGIETTRRLRREWAIRVAQGATDMLGIACPPNHKYLPLARIDRLVEDGSSVNDASIMDLRRKELNLSKYLKTPIFLKRGTKILDAEDFERIMNDLREILILRLQLRVFSFGYVDPYNVLLIQLAIEDIIHQTAFAAIEARAGNFNNQDGLNFMNTLHRLQKEFVRVIEQYCNLGDVAREFIDEYTARLDDSPGGLKPALDNDDLIVAADAQNVINAWLSAPVDLLPEGSVIVRLLSVEPTTNLAFNIPFNITYEIVSRVESPRVQETFKISYATTTPTTWEISLNKSQIELENSGGRDTVILTVTPRAGSMSARFELTSSAVRNPTAVTFTHVSDIFRVGEPPPGAEFFQWVSPTLDENERVPFNRDDFTAGGGGVEFRVNLINTSDTETYRFKLRYFVVPPTGQEGQWHPTEAETTPTQIELSPGEIRTSANNIIFDGINPDLGTEGTIVAESTLIEANGSSVTDGKSKRFELTFVVISSG